jgi:hypothetical protein
MTYPFSALASTRTLALAAAINMWVAPAMAIVVNHVDDFSDGTTQDWGVGHPDVFPVNQPESGPGGAGDSALWMATVGAGGSSPHLLVINTSSDWTGNWTAAGIARIQMDVLGPSSNSFGLQMRLGVVGPNPPVSGGSGNTWVTPAMAVPSDNQWHRLTFDVLASDFISFAGTNIDSALSSVAHFRILHNPDVSFSGADPGGGGGEFFLDNITALAAASTPTTTGDYNGNGIVDAADYVRWRDTLNQTVSTPGDGADGDQSGTIDAGDYTFWRGRFGNVVSGIGQGSSATRAVPEPSLVSFLIVSLLIFGAATRIRPLMLRSSREFIAK